MVLKTAGPTPEQRLRPTVAWRYKVALRAGLRGMVRRDHLQDAPSPGQLVGQLPAELVPPLVQDSLVQPSFLSHMPAGIIQGAFSRSAHIPYPQVLHDNDRVVFADLSGDLMQVVLAGIGYAEVQPRDLLFLFPPVFSKPPLAGKPALFPGQLLLPPAEAVQGFVNRAVRQRSKPVDAQVDAHRGAGRMFWLGKFPLSLDGHKPMPAPAGDRNVFGSALDVPAPAVTNPADFGEVYPAAVELKSLGIAAAVLSALFPEPGHTFDFLQAVPQGPVQISQDLLQGLGRSFPQKAVLLALLPKPQEPGQILVAQERGPACQPGQLQRQGLVPDKPAVAADAPELPVMAGFGLKAVFIALV